MPLPVVLVHGGGHGAWCWAPMLEHLAADAFAVDLPPREIRGGPERFGHPPALDTLTVADFAASVLADADAAGYDRFVLVGHSLAGVTIPEVAKQAPERVAHLVFVSCTVPPDGTSSFDTRVDAPERQVLDQRADTERTDNSAGPGLPEPLQRAMFCNDMDDEQTRFVLDHFGTEVPGVVVEPVSRAGVPAEIPKTWVRLLQDAAVSVEQQDASIANLEVSPGGTVTVVDLDAGHNAMVSRPRELAAVIDGIAAAAS
jgi:pimeloyl-ACP methyl ester carboxylesterase